jgi:hypothetical protein
MQAACSSETSEQPYYTTRCKNPKGQNLNSNHIENIKQCSNSAFKEKSTYFLLLIP